VAAAVSLVAPGLILPVVVGLAGGLDIRVTVSIALIVLIVDIGLVLFGHMIAPLGPRAHRFEQDALIVLRVLQEVLGHHTVAGSLSIAGERLILVDDLLRGAAHLALGPGAFVDAVHVVAVRLAVTAPPRAVLLLRWSHRVFLVRCGQNRRGSAGRLACSPDALKSCAASLIVVRR